MPIPPDNLDLFKTTMPSSRLADYYLGCLDGCIFIDFNNNDDHLIKLIRISFDGYGCCQLDGNAVPMNPEDSQLFREQFKQTEIDQLKMGSLILRTIENNKHLIWEDALEEYKLI